MKDITGDSQIVIIGCKEKAILQVHHRGDQAGFKMASQLEIKDYGPVLDIYV